MDLIADGTLSELPKHNQPLWYVDIAILQCSSKCLATALAFLHDRRIQHKDIELSKILLSKGRVSQCDFGISIEWTLSEHGPHRTIKGNHSSFTRRYAAPEVFSVDTGRNSKTDIWSLGCVLLEIFGAVQGFSFDDIDVGESVNGQGLSSTAMRDWLRKVRNVREILVQDFPRDWILAMVRCYGYSLSVHTHVSYAVEDPARRLEVSLVATKIHEDTVKHGF